MSRKKKKIYIRIRRFNQKPIRGSLVCNGEISFDKSLNNTAFECHVKLRIWYRFFHNQLLIEIIVQLTTLRKCWCIDDPWRKFLFYSDRQELLANDTLYILLRMERGVDSSEYCWESVAHIHTGTKGGNEMISFLQENTEALDRIIATG